MKKVLFLAMTFATLGVAKANDSLTSPNNSSQTIHLKTPPTLESLKKDPDIVWIGEVFVDYGFNYDKYTCSPAEKEKMENIGIKDVNIYKILKYQIKDVESGDNDEHTLINKLIQNIGSITCYKDDQLTVKMTLKERQDAIQRVDTVITFDPKIMDEVISVVASIVDPGDVKFFRLKQLVYYSKKEMTFKALPLAIAPMSFKNYYINKTETEPLFWLKPNFIESIPSLGLEEITWAKRMYRNFSIDNAKVLKEEYPFAKVIDKMMEDIRANAEKVVVGTVLDADGTQKMPTEQVRVLGTSEDTATDLVDADGNKIKKINSFDNKNVKSLRLMQDFVWDSKTNELSIRFVGFKLNVNRYDNQGKLVESRPVFSLKVADNIKK